VGPVGASLTPATLPIVTSKPAINRSKTPPLEVAVELCPYLR